MFQYYKKTSTERGEYFKNHKLSMIYGSQNYEITKNIYGGEWKSYEKNLDWRAFMINKLSTVESFQKVQSHWNTVTASIGESFEKVMKNIQAGDPLWQHRIEKSELLQSGQKSLQTGTGFGYQVITRWDNQYYKVGQFYCKVGRVLQSGTIITK